MSSTRPLALPSAFGPKKGDSYDRRPLFSGSPSIRFMFWIAAPEAPLPRLSIWMTIRAWPSGFGITEMSQRLVSFVVRGSNAGSEYARASSIPWILTNCSLA